MRDVLTPSAGPPKRTRQTHFEVARNTAKEAVSISVTPPCSGKRSRVWEENRPVEKKMKEAEDAVERIGEDVGASGSRITVKFLDSLILRYVFVVAYMFVQVLLTFWGNTCVPQLCFAPSLRGSVSSKNYL